MLEHPDITRMNRWGTLSNDDNDDREVVAVCHMCEQELYGEGEWVAADRYVETEDVGVVCENCWWEYFDKLEKEQGR